MRTGKCPHLGYTVQPSLLSIKVCNKSCFPPQFEMMQNWSSLHQAGCSCLWTNQRPPQENSNCGKKQFCYMNMLKHKTRVAFVTKFWDYFYNKVGCLMSMLIALDPRGIDFAYPAEFERRSVKAGSQMPSQQVSTFCHVFPSAWRWVWDRDPTKNSALCHWYVMLNGLYK